MIIRRVFLAAALLACTALTSRAQSLNEQARFLAGLRVNDPALRQLAGDPRWAAHAVDMDKAWGRQQERQISQVRSWSRSFVPGSQGTGSVFYMFSGPDILYGQAFFPNASDYILCGTEPVGRMPNLSEIPSPQLEGALAGVRQSLKTILSFHYFITKEMRVDLTRNQLAGTTPILCIFLTRMGNTIHEIEYLKAPAPGVKITFSGDAGRRQSVYYFNCDLSNGGSNAAFLNWTASRGPGMSLVKAASYLMHRRSFSKIRDFLLKNSHVIVQDDSGIPLRDFNPGWTVRFFGSYVQPIELFKEHYQADLAQVYQTSNPADLGFAFGYHWQRERGMIMVATPN